jgi:hypothetical protein
MVVLADRRTLVVSEHSGEAMTAFRFLDDVSLADRHQ